MAIYEHLGRKFGKGSNILIKLSCGSSNFQIPGLVPGPADESEWTNLDLFREQAKELIPVTTTYLYSPQDRAKVRILKLMLNRTTFRH